MKADPIQEPPIDVSLTHYLEERALAIALEKASTPAHREKVERLIELRSALMRQRDALISALSSPKQKFPSKRNAMAVLAKVRAALASLDEKKGRAHFEVDI